MRALLTIALATLALPAAAQAIDVGARIGVPFNDLVDAGGSLKGASQNWTGGPTLEINLPAGFGIEFDILYRKIGYSGTAESNASAWTFPLLAKYKFGRGAVRPFVDAGFAARKLTDLKNLDASGKGFVMGAGVRLDLKIVRLSPEIRWTRWGEDRYNLSTLASHRNEASILVGVTF
jgi:hypothetical protein